MSDHSLVLALLGAAILLLLGPIGGAIRKRRPSPSTRRRRGDGGDGGSMGGDGSDGDCGSDGGGDGGGGD